MRLLLDTHAFLWFVIGDTRLSGKARALIEDESNEKFFSIASLWEIAIKVSIGRLTLSAPFDDVFPAQLVKNGIDLLGITVAHTSAVTSLPYHHRDPFDRLLIAQASREQMQIVSIDESLDAYPIVRLW